MTLSDILGQAVLEVWNQRERFFKALVLPFTAWFVVDMIGYFDLSWPSILVIGLVSLIIFSLFAVTIHRLIILGPESVPEYGLSRVSKREVMFGGIFLWVSILSMLVLVPIYIFITLLVNFPDILISTGGGFQISIQVLLWGFIVLAVYIGSRLALVLPAIATDCRISLRDSWRMTRKYRLQLLLLIGALPFIIGIPGMVFDLLPEVIGLVTYSIYKNATFVLTVSVVSVVYREITRKE